MKRLFLILVTLSALNLLPERTFAAGPERPNIIFILADDLGIDGVSCYGADKRRTPHIDQLAASGIRFETCYAAPLCGPSRSVLMTGRYAFRTGGLRNSSWAEGGPGPKSSDEHPVAAVLKQAGYATGQAGKWRQVGETPHDWGFDEYVTDPTASGWYWKSSYIENGKTVEAGADVYNPDVIQKFTLDFIRRHKDQPFFFYYAMHFVHKPILHTPDSKDKSDRAEQYDENIAYMDKQVGEVVAELQKLGLREKTVVLFSGDNGTFGQYCTPVHGRMVHGSKGSMFEGGSRVPLVASWPAVVTAGKVSQDIVCFADMLTTFAELGGAKLPEGFKYDGQSFAPQLRGEKGSPRPWAFVQLGGFWFVREPGWKMNERGELFDMSDAPYTEKPVDPAADTADSKAARARLSAALADLAPAKGKSDAGEGNAKKKGNKGANKDRKRAKRRQAASSPEK